MSDHSSFIATLNETAKLCQPKGKINYRSHRKFNFENFKNALTNSDLIQNPDTTSVTSLYTQYHDTSMSTLLDKHEPLKSCKVTPNAIPVNEWITGEILLSKRKKRQFEKIWRMDRTDSNRSRLNAQVHLCNRLRSEATNYTNTNLVSENFTNPRKLWDIMKYILHKKTNNKLHSSCNTKLASSFNDFFISKIAKIRDTLMSAKSDSNIHPEPTPPAAPNLLLTFSQISESNVSKLIWSTPSKLWDLDPCPTQIAKDSADILAGSIIMIINLSLAGEKFADTFKITHATPLLRKPSLDRNELSNFRPVSGLNVVFKLIEKIVASQIKFHMQNSGIPNNLQSAYKCGNSTETALLYIQMIFCQLKTVVNLLLFRSWICLRLLTPSIMTSCSVDWLSGLALMVWCCSGFDPTWPVVLNLLKLMVFCNH